MNSQETRKCRLRKLLRPWLFGQNKTKLVLMCPAWLLCRVTTSCQWPHELGH